MDVRVECPCLTEAIDRISVGLYSPKLPLRAVFFVPGFVYWLPAKLPGQG